MKTKAKLLEKPTRRQEIFSELEILETKLEMLMQEDRTSYAQGIIDKMFSEFKKGGQWTKRMEEFAKTRAYVFSPNGRKRNLPAVLTEDRTLVSQQVRRGSNAPIQGLASEVGVKASRKVMESYYAELPKIKKMLGIKRSIWDLRVPFNRIVHDASYFSVPYCMVIPFSHILQWESTYGITKAYKDEFDIEFTIEPEIEMEFSSRDDQSYKWDWSMPSVVDCITKAVKDAEELGILDEPVDAVLKQIFRPWANKEVRTYLQKKYPLLGVPDLDKQIVAAIRPIFRG